MHLTDIELRHWRGLDALEIASLSPARNLVYGRNEAGKSRLFEALRYGLIEPCKGRAEHNRRLQGRGCGEPPRVTVLFEAGGRDYRLVKQFLQKPFCVVEGDGQTRKDEEAEAWLRELLSLDAAKCALKNSETLGVWPLVWVQQGASRKAPHECLNDGTRGRLQDRLAAAVGGALLGPRGAAVLEKAEAEFARYFTPTGRPTGEYAAAQKACEAARATFEAADAQARLLAGRIGELQDREAQALALRPRLQRLIEEMAAAEERDRQARAAREHLLVQEQAVEGAALARGQAEARLQAARDLAEESVKAEQELAAARQDLARERQNLEACRARLNAADAALAQAAAAYEAASARLEAARASAARRELAVRHTRLRERCTEAVDLGGALTGHRARLAGIRVDAARLQEIDRLDREAGTARARLEAGVARLRLTARATIQVNGETFAAGASRDWSCDRELELRLGDWALVTVSPGNEAAAGLREACEGAERDLRAALAAAGVADVTEAHAAAERRVVLEQECAVLTARLQLLTPLGVEVLRAEVAAAEAELAAATGPDDPALPAAGVDAVAAVTRVWQAAEDTLRDARVRQTALAGALGEAQVRVKGAETTAHFRAVEVERVAAARARLDETALAAAVAAADCRWREALALREQHRREYLAAGGESAADDLRQAREALAALQAEWRRVEDARIALTAGLEELQGRDPYERRATAEAEWHAQKQALASLEARARAAQTLKGALDACRLEAQERFSAPVLEAVRPLLAHVFPDRALALSDTWEVDGLRAGNTLDDFDSLSGGAQEQLGILVRLGLATLLAGGERLPMILDDALVNADAVRLRAMLRALYHASERLQVIVLTCQDGDYDPFAAERRYELPGHRGMA